MPTKAEIKYYSSLLKKKGRTEEKKFLIEGKRLVEEGLKSNFKCLTVLVSSHFNEVNSEFIEKLHKSGFNPEIVNNKDFASLSDTENPQGIAAVFEMPQFQSEIKHSRLIVALENISDPGNAGTIIRTCDWFGISEIILSENSVDIYNSKVIRSSMGSVFHLRINESDGFLKDLKKLKTEGYKIICSDMNGENVYQFKPAEKTVLVFSNEANGPSDELIEISDKIVTIPRYGRAESLNVATASAVIISEAVKSRKP